ncbi:MAG: ferredoxin reductase family protein [Actinomycetes bacterium]
MAKSLTRKRASLRLDAAATITGLGLGFTLAVLVSTLSVDDVNGPYPIITTISRVAALSGSYLALVGLMMVARIPWIERAVGHDRLVLWHRKSAPYSLFLILSHVLLVVLGYAATDRIRVGAELWRLVTTYPWMLPAFVAFILFMSAGVSSYKRVRAKIKYETWWTIHLYTYLGIALSFMHQIQTGVMFINHPLNRAYWIALYVIVVVNIINWRVIIPLIKSFRLKLKVEKVEVEGPRIISIYVSGKNIAKLGAKGGQFFNWRFLTTDHWYESHPFSLSAAPKHDQLRLTVKNLGDHSSSLVNLKKGTRVMVEGPYGTFTASRADVRRPLVLVGGGVGITPIRAMIEDLPPHTSVDLIYRTSRTEDLIMKAELEALCDKKGIRLHLMAGSRSIYPLDAKALKSLIYNVRDAEFYVCGPSTLTDAIKKAALDLKMPASRVHHEIFEYHAVLEKE